MTAHWHDTPLFEQIRDQRVAALRSTDEDEASHVCEHQGVDYFMRSQRTGQGHFMCHTCCVENVELELLCMVEPPAEGVLDSRDI